MSDSDVPISADSLHLRLAAANALIRRRRSIKPVLMDEDKPVDPAILGNILENANWAPTHGMTEPWRFKIFMGDSRENLADSLQRIYKEITPEAEFRPDKYEKLGNTPLLAPVVICICMKRQEIEKIPEIEEVEAVACAVHNMHLTASALGMAAFWSSPPLVYTEAMNQFLELGVKDKCLGLFYLGWPLDEEDWPQGERKPIQEKLEWFE